MKYSPPKSPSLLLTQQRGGLEEFITVITPPLWDVSLREGAGG